MQELSRLASIGTNGDTPGNCKRDLLRLLKEPAFEVSYYKIPLLTGPRLSIFHILYSIFYILYSRFYILYSIFYILYVVFYIPYSVSMFYTCYIILYTIHYMLGYRELSSSCNCFYCHIFFLQRCMISFALHLMTSYALARISWKASGIARQGTRH